MTFPSNSRTLAIASAVLLASTFGAFARTSALDVADAATTAVPGHVLNMAMIIDDGKEFYEVVILDLKGVHHTLRMDDKNAIVSHSERSDMMNDYIQGNNR